MLGPGLMRTAPGVLRNVGSEGDDVAASLPAMGAGVALDREAARAPPLEPPPRPRLGGIFVVDVNGDFSFGGSVVSVSVVVGGGAVNNFSRG